MPSPLSHVGMGYVIYRAYRGRFSQNNSEKIWIVPRNLLIIAGLSLMADMDSIIGFLTGQFGRYHNNLTHSLIFGLLVAVIFAGVFAWKQGSPFTPWLVVALISYEMHVVMDFFTVGRGVMLLWPFSASRFASPVKLFYGLHWSEGWISIRHFWTLVTETGFFLLLIVVLNLLERIKRKTSPPISEVTPTSTLFHDKSQ
jgi:inner membrane protein